MQKVTARSCRPYNIIYTTHTMTTQRNTLWLLLVLAAWLLPFGVQAADVYLSVSPTMTVTGDGHIDEEATEYGGNAPMYAVFRANPQDLGDYEALYEWRFTRQNETEPFLVRYDQDTEYNFTESGSYYVELRVSFVLGTDTIEYAQDTPFSISINESILEFPNAFTPNDDGANDVFKAKDTYQSIVKFNAKIFNRWGKLLYEWNDPAGSWDGTFHGREVPDGAYYLNCQADGADGRHYSIKKTINLLRRYEENTGAIE